MAATVIAMLIMNLTIRTKVVGEERGKEGRKGQKEGVEEERSEEGAGGRRKGRSVRKEQKKGRREEGTEGRSGGRKE